MYSFSSSNEFQPKLRSLTKLLLYVTVTRALLGLGGWEEHDAASMVAPIAAYAIALSSSCIISSFGLRIVQSFAIALRLA